MQQMTCFAGMESRVAWNNAVLSRYLQTDSTIEVTGESGVVREIAEVVMVCHRLRADTLLP